MTQNYRPIVKTADVPPAPLVIIRFSRSGKPIVFTQIIIIIIIP